MCCQSDEILSAWLFFLASLPSVVYVWTYLLIPKNQNFEYYAMMIAAILFCITSGLFVYSCYRRQYNDAGKIEEPAPIFKKWLTMCCGSRLNFIERHCSTDWLVALWISFFGSVLCTIGCVALLIKNYHNGNQRQLYIYSTGIANMVFFVIGSMYYLAGSYNPVHTFLDTKKIHNEISELQMKSSKSQPVQDFICDVYCVKPEICCLYLLLITIHSGVYFFIYWR